VSEAAIRYSTYQATALDAAFAFVDVLPPRGSRSAVNSSIT